MLIKKEYKDETVYAIQPVWKDEGFLKNQQQKTRKLNSIISLTKTYLKMTVIHI
jgi:hypothetical protein